MTSTKINDRSFSPTIDLPKGEQIADIDNDVAVLAQKLGESNDSVSSSSLFGKIASISSNLASHISTWSSTRAGYIDRLANGTYGLDKIKSAVDNVKSVVDTISSNVSNLNSRITSTRAGYLDMLNNSTYGLNAIKTAVNKIPTTSSGGIKSVTKTFTQGSTAVTDFDPVMLYAVKITSYSYATNPSYFYNCNSLFFTNYPEFQEVKRIGFAASASNYYSGAYYSYRDDADYGKFVIGSSSSYHTVTVTFYYFG